MRIIKKVFIPLIALLPLFFIFCGSQESSLFLPEIIDYTHIGHINALLKRRMPPNMRRIIKKQNWNLTVYGTKNYQQPIANMCSINWHLFISP